MVNRSASTDCLSFTITVNRTGEIKKKKKGLLFITSGLPAAQKQFRPAHHLDTGKLCSLKTHTVESTVRVCDCHWVKCSQRCDTEVDS